MFTAGDKAALDDVFAHAMASAGFFESSPTLAVAVSGGADSMALLLLAHEWACRRSGSVIALTVEHGLRTESASEAEQVKRWCTALTIEHHTLVWKGKKPLTGIQAAAREARYRLLTDWCRRNRILHLFTAHHRDDQAETLLMRAGRGSGFAGLAAMPAITLRNGIRLLRPLLNLPKSELILYMTGRHHPWLEDPSNHHAVYTRSAVRQLLTPLHASRAGTLANQFSTIRNILENNKVSCITNCISIYPEGYATLSHEQLKILPRDYGLHLLAAVAATISGKSDPLRSEKLLRLWEELTDARPPRRRTLSGCVWRHVPASSLLLAMREPNAIQAPLTLYDDSPSTWDSRFMVQCRMQADIPEVTVKKAGPALLRKLVQPKAPHGFLPPKAVFETLPSFWVLEELAAIPHIGYHHPHFAALDCRAFFRPAKPLAGSLFYGMTDNAI